MKKKSRRTGEGHIYDVVPYRHNGIRYSIFVCHRCAKAWKLRDPVESWRIKTLLTHFQAHRTDSAVTELMEGAAKDIEV